MEKSQPILVTGAAGFVGSHLVEYLKSQGYSKVYGTTISDSPWLTETIGAEFVCKLDLTDQAAVTELLARIQPHWIFHLAALPFVGESFDRAQETLQTNTNLQLVMLEAVRASAPQARVLSVGSATAYGLLPPSFNRSAIREDFPFYPNSPYAVSKITQDYLGLAYHLSYGLDIVRVRPFNQVGPRQVGSFALASFIKQIVEVEKGGRATIAVGNLDPIRDFTDVRDAVRAYVILMEQGKAGEAYNLGSGKGVQMRDLLDLALHVCGRQIPIEVDLARMRPVDVPEFVADNQKIRALGWQPTIPLEKTLHDILEYERKQE